MVKPLTSDIDEKVVDSWDQEKVTLWLKEKGWEQFATTFQEHNICRERFFQLTLAELVHYLPRTMTTYYERRRLLNEIRSLVPSSPGNHTIPTNISINTNIYELRDNTTQPLPTIITTATRDSGIGYFSLYSAGSSSSTTSPSISPSSDFFYSFNNTTSSKKSPTTTNRTSYSPKAAFNKLKNTFRSSPSPPQTQQTKSPRTSTSNAWHESELPAIPARVSSTPDKISKFWATTCSHWNTSEVPKKPAVELQQKIQITGDKETWYSLNVTNMRDPVMIKRHVLQRMNYDYLNENQYQFYHENGFNPENPMDPQELMYLCSIADHSAKQRILVKPCLLLNVHPTTTTTTTKLLSTPELGKSPTTLDIPTQQSPNRIVSPSFKPLCRKTARRPKIPPSAKSSVGIQLVDPPYLVEPRSKSDNQVNLWAVTPPEIKSEFWGERPPAEVVFEHMESYFDSKDLDKEVTIEMNNTLLKKHTKSIRLVAREASQRHHKTSMLRRKSTKLWGQKVVEVKSVARRLPSVSEHMRLSHKQESHGEVQWIRGKLIGKGSFGRVYLAFNVATGEVIAVKQVEIPKTASDLLNKQQHDMVDSLYQEIMMLRDLDHENIVQYLGYGHDNLEGVINIFLDYISGGSVASRLACQGAFDESLTVYFTRQICSGLEYLHSKHILHRDIKAANILVQVDGICKISDFGLSKKNDYDEVYDQNSRMSLSGSIYWMAPEVVKNEPYSAKVDIWSLGCTVLEMLTGQRPWMSLNQIAALYNLGKLNCPTIPENISDCAKDFLKQCFIIDPIKRPTATDLLQHPFLKPDPSFQFKDYVDKGKV